MLLVRTIGEPIQKLRRLVARGLVRLGVTPHVLTLLGFVVTLGTGACFATGHPRWAVATILLAGAFDMLDGTVARLSNRVTDFGAVLDSSVDRYSDATIFGGIIWFYARAGDRVCVALAASALVGSLIISYVRARAECLIDSCKVGFFERGERLVTLMLGAMFGNMPAALWILGTLTHWTAVVRMHHAARVLAGKVPPPKNTLFGQLYHMVFWDFDRGSIQFDVWALIVAAAAIWLPV
jgi:CDP-diacylglycerol--glycerol-3-phosphate 3-phosphatidyltransferase